MTQALRDDQPDATQLPADLPESTVSEIASWLVGQPLDAVERELIRHTLESCGGDRALTASVLGISLPNLRKKIRAYSVRGEALPHSFEPAREIPQAANDGVPDAQGNAVEESALEAKNENLSELHASDPTAEVAASEPAPTLAVPEPDNDPRLTLVETETVSEPVAAQPEPEIRAAPATAAEIVPAAHADTVVEAPKLIAGIATPRTKQKRNYTGLVVAGMIALLIAAPIAYGLVSTQEKSTAIDIDRNRLEVTAIDSPRFEQRIQVPVWATPAAQAMPVDIAADRRTPRPAPVEAAVQAQPVAVATVSEPAAAPAAPAPAEAVIASTPMQTVNDFISEAGTEMALGAIDIAADVAMPLGPANRLADLRMELSPADIAADTRMDAGPANILADVRMEFVEPDVTGSIPVATFFKAPKNAPAPLAREDPDAEQPVRRAAPRPARVAPAQAQVPAQNEAFPLIFPFSLFAPKNAQSGAAAANTPQPVDCCIR